MTLLGSSGFSAIAVERRVSQRRPRRRNVGMLLSSTIVAIDNFCMYLINFAAALCTLFQKHPLATEDCTISYIS